jgi:hypothetical protein
MALGSTQPLTEMDTGNMPARKADNLTPHLFADYLENVGTSMAHDPVSLHGILRG